MWVSVSLARIAQYRRSESGPVLLLAHKLTGLTSEIVDLGELTQTPVCADGSDQVRAWLGSYARGPAVASLDFENNAGGSC